MVLKTEKARRWYHANRDIFRGGSPSEIMDHLGEESSGIEEFTDGFYLLQEIPREDSEYGFSETEMWDENDPDDRNLPDSYYEG